MRIGFVVDGQAEYRSLPELLRRIETPHVLLDPLYADIQPFAPVPQIVGTVKAKLPILRARHAQKVVVLIDRENNPVCPGAWAQEITTTLNAKCAQQGIPAFAVVVKDSCYENWLVADTAVFAKLSKRFSLSTAAIRSIEPNKADRIDAQQLLKSAARGASYSKVRDAVRIMTLAEAISIAANSRSFRRLLRVVEHPTYVYQSRKPA